MNSQQLNRLQKLLDQKTNLSSAQFTRELIKLYQNSLNFTVSELNKLFKKLGTHPDLPLASIRLENIYRQIAEDLKKLNITSNSHIKGSIQNIYMLNYNTLGTGIISQITTGVTFGVIDRNAVRTNLLNNYNWQGALSRYNYSTLQTVKEAVSNGLLTGQSYPKIISDAKRGFDIAANNAARIVKTELHRATSVARLDAIEQTSGIAESLGYKQVKIWQSAIDNRTRSEHLEVNGATIPTSENFIVGGEEIPGPGFGSPANVINCRCVLRIDLIENAVS